MRNYETLNAELTTTDNTEPVVSSLEAAAKTVEVIDLARNTASVDVRAFLADTLPTYGNVASMLQALASERQNWERTELAASHARLYGILTKCYEFYLALKSDKTTKAARKTLMGGLDLFIETQGFKTLAKTHDMNKVVKAVFGEDRRRVSAYAMALRAALVAGPSVTPIPADELAGWIDQNGGVEEIRLGSKNKGMTEKERANTAKATVADATPLLTITPDAKAMLFDSNDVDKMMVLLVTYCPTGDLEVKCVVKNDTAVRAALAAYYADNKKDIAAAKQTKQQTSTSAIATALSD